MAGDNYNKSLQPDKTICFYCGGAMEPSRNLKSPLRSTREHIEPKVHGGNSSGDNIVFVHSKCNSLRGAKLLDFLIKALPENFIAVQIEKLITYRKNNLHKIRRGYEGKPKPKRTRTRKKETQSVLKVEPFGIRIAICGGQFYLRNYGISPSFHEDNTSHISPTVSVKVIGKVELPINKTKPLGKSKRQQKNIIHE